VCVEAWQGWFILRYVISKVHSFFALGSGLGGLGKATGIVRHVKQALIISKPETFWILKSCLTLMTAGRTVFIYLFSEVLYWHLPLENNRKSETCILPVIKCVKIIGLKKREAKSALFAMLGTKSWSVWDPTWGNSRCGVGPGIKSVVAHMLAILAYVCSHTLLASSSTGESYSLQFSSFHCLQREALNLYDLVWSPQFRDMLQYIMSFRIYFSCNGWYSYISFLGPFSSTV
jgi:hypothetical protein